MEIQRANERLSPFNNTRVMETIVNHRSSLTETHPAIIHLFHTLGSRHKIYILHIPITWQFFIKKLSHLFIVHYII